MIDGSSVPLRSSKDSFAESSSATGGVGVVSSSAAAIDGGSSMGGAGSAGFGCFCTTGAGSVLRKSCAQLCFGGPSDCAVGLTPAVAGAALTFDAGPLLDPAPSVVALVSQSPLSALVAETFQLESSVGTDFGSPDDRTPFAP